MKTWLALALAIGLSACGKDLTADLERLANAACECKDAACGSKVLDDVVALAKANPKARTDKDKADAAAKRMGVCLVTAGVPVSELSTKLGSL